MDDIKLDKINIKNCLGTVLAINGFRKYYYIYSVRKGREFIRRRNNVSKALGLDDLDEKSDEDEVKDAKKVEDDYYFVEELLDGLHLWLDKVFDGSIKRIRITEWPEMTDTLGTNCWCLDYFKNTLSYSRNCIDEMSKCYKW